MQRWHLPSTVSEVGTVPAIGKVFAKEMPGDFRRCEKEGIDWELQAKRQGLVSDKGR